METSKAQLVVPTSATPVPPRTWRSTVLGVGLFCTMAGLFFAAGLKTAIWPKVLGVGGMLAMAIAGIASALASRREKRQG